VKRIATFVHISDVHIGDVTFDPMEPLDSEALDWWRRHPLLDGFLGHSHVALRHLRDRVAELFATEDARLLFTGDLTTVGDEMQYLVGRTYLEGRLVFGHGALLGLEEPEALQRGIPGNHDRWPGNRGIIGDPTPALPFTFPDVPGIVTLPLTGRDPRKVVLFVIDSEADVNPWGIHRIAARGDFVSQLDALRTWSLPPTAGDEIRVMLLHHTPLVKGRFVDRIRRRSQRALDNFIEDHDICMLLNGHVHEPLAETTSMSSGDRTWSMGIVCAGTTTQRDEPPSAWGLSLAEVERFRLNTLAVHRIMGDVDGSLFWTVEFELRTEKGFRPVKEPDIPPIQVWPRP
jgi:3',5'-cyclic AMP phosphodiesterase CpdA